MPYFLCYISPKKEFLKNQPFSHIRLLHLNKPNLHTLNRAKPSATGIAAMLDAGLADIGDVAVVGVATDSTGTVPACGEDEEEEGPGGAPPTMFCRGERGLCPVKTHSHRLKK